MRASHRQLSAKPVPRMDQITDLDQRQRKRARRNRIGLLLYASYKTGGLFAVAFFTFAFQFAIATNCFRLFASLLYRWLLVVTAHFHFAEQTLALHFLFQSAQCLIDVVIAYDDLYYSNHLVSGRRTVPAPVIGWGKFRLKSGLGFSTIPEFRKHNMGLKTDPRERVRVFLSSGA